MQTITDRLETLLADQPGPLLKPDQVTAYHEELERLAAGKKWGQESGPAADARLRIEKTLKQAPRPIEEPERRAEVERLANALLAEKIIPRLQPVEVMRRNPAGAVGAYQRGEASREGKRDILVWKKARRRLRPTETDPDYTNVEVYRPSLAAPGAAAPTFMADAQIPGAFAMSPAAKANWPLGAPAVRTALDGAGYEPADAAAPQPTATTVTGVCQYRKCGTSFAYAPLPNGKAKLFCTDKHAQYERSARSMDKAKARKARPAPAPQAAPSAEA